MKNSISQLEEHMKLKLSPTLVILGLFLFKVGVFDNIRSIAHHHDDNLRGPSSERDRNFSIR